MKSLLLIISLLFSNIAICDLTLQGQSIRKKLMFDIYKASFYSENKISDPLQALTDKSDKKMVLKFIYKKLSPKKIQHSFEDGIKNNNTLGTIIKYETEIKTFLNCFNEDIYKDDIISIEFNNNSGIKVKLNNKIKGEIKNSKFFPIILSTWMGKKPPSLQFQKELLTYKLNS